MKIQKKNSQGLYLQSRNNRWKWMAGATAATAAGVTASQANTITINLLNNYISADANTLNADLTGDGHPDVILANVFNYRYHRDTSFGSYYNRFYAKVSVSGVLARARGNVDRGGTGTAQLGSHVETFYRTQNGRSSAAVTGSIPISFKDLNINGGRLTKGFLMVDVSVVPVAPFTYDARVQLDSLTYQTPDQGSSLALLAMGAGGIIALRRWRTAQGRS